MSLPSTVRDALADTGITYRQLDYWCRKGWLRPVRDGESSGIDRWWPPLELAVARRMVELIGEGYTASAAAVKAREQVAA